MEMIQDPTNQKHAKLRAAPPNRDLGYIAWVHMHPTHLRRYEIFSFMPKWYSIWFDDIKRKTSPFQPYKKQSHEKESLRYLSSTFFQVVKVSMAKVTGICKSWEDISFSTSQRQKVTSSQDHHVKILDRATLTSKNEWSWNTKLLPFYWLLSRWFWDSQIMFL